MMPTLTPSRRLTHTAPRLTRPALRWLAPLAALLLMGLLASVILSFNLNRRPQAVALATVVPSPTPTPAPGRVQVEIPLKYFAIWGLPHYATLPSRTPVELWASWIPETTVDQQEPATRSDLIQMTSSAWFIDQIVGTVGVDPVSLLVFDVDDYDGDILERILQGNPNTTQLVAVLDPDRQAPRYALTEERGWWRQTPGYETVVIPLERINFTSNDVFLGDRVTVHARRGENQDSLETLATAVLVLDIDVQPDAQQTEYIALQVQSSEAATIEQLLLESLQFELLKEPDSTRLPIAAVYPSSVIDSDVASAIMQTCGLVNVMQVSLYTDADDEGTTPPPTVTVESLARGVRVLAAPINDWASWVLQFASQNEANKVWEARQAGGLYLDPACP